MILTVQDELNSSSNHNLREKALHLYLQNVHHRISHIPQSKDTLQILMYWIMGQHSGQKCFKNIDKIGGEDK